MKFKINCLDLCYYHSMSVCTESIYLQKLSQSFKLEYLQLLTVLISISIQLSINKAFYVTFYRLPPPTFPTGNDKKQREIYVDKRDSEINNPLKLRLSMNAVRASFERMRNNRKAKWKEKVQLFSPFNILITSISAFNDTIVH